MSGPKVVRVITREELLARALDQISLLEAAVERYSALGRRHDVNLSGEISSHRRAIAELKELTQTNTWDMVARRSADALRTVEHERKTLESNIIAAATKVRTVRRRLREAAQAIQREARALNVTVPGELQDVIANAEKATADQLKRMNAIIATASRALVQQTVKSKSLDAGLAKRLAAGLSQENYTDWLTNNAISVESQKSVRLDKILAELELREFVMTKHISAAIHRIQAADDDKRDVLIDSLTIELNGLLKAHQERNDDAARIKAQIALLEREGSREAQELIQIARAFFASARMADVRDWERRTEEFLKTSRAKANVLHQRKALLSGLTALGYEVREGMATALVEKGRLVVKKPAEAEYGVEIVSGGATGRLQVRMVSFQSTSNPTRDKDIEVIWCGEFSQLQASLGRAGHALNIDDALAPGVAPMKREQLHVEQSVDPGGSVKQPVARSV